MNEITIDPKKWKLYESAFIKSIRRCLADDAVYWGLVCYRLGRPDNMWRRMFIHLSEDVGLAEPHIAQDIEALYRTWITLRDPEGKAAYESENNQFLPFIHAVMLLAYARKSRAVDNAYIVHCKAPFVEREVPDYATDLHSPKGRRMGRDIEHWITEASRINNEPIRDPWRESSEEFQRGTNKEKE